MSRENESPSSGPQGRGPAPEGGAAYPSGTPPYPLRDARDGADGASRSATPDGQDDAPKTETTLTTRIRINIPGSRPIPPVVVRTPVDGQAGQADAPAEVEDGGMAGGAVGMAGAASASAQHGGPGPGGGAASGSGAGTGSGSGAGSGSGDEKTSDWFAPRKGSPTTPPAGTGTSGQGAPPPPPPDTGPTFPSFAPPPPDDEAVRPRDEAPEDEPPGFPGVPLLDATPPGYPATPPSGTPVRPEGAQYGSPMTPPGGTPTGPVPMVRPDLGTGGHGFAADDPAHANPVRPDAPRPRPTGPGPGGSGPGSLGPESPGPGGAAPSGPAGPTSGPGTGSFPLTPPQPPPPGGPVGPITPPPGGPVGPITPPPGGPGGPPGAEPPVSSDTIVGGIPVVPPPSASGPPPGQPPGPYSQEPSPGPYSEPPGGPFSYPSPPGPAFPPGEDRPVPYAQSAPASPAPAPSAPPKRRDNRKLAVLAGSGVAGVLAVAYGAGLVLNHADVPNGTTVLGVDIGGSSRDEAVSKLDDALKDRMRAPLKVKVGDQVKELKPHVAGLGIDTADTVRGATGSDYNPVTVIGSLFGGDHEVDPVMTDDNDKLRSALQTLADTPGRGAGDGMIVFTGGKAKAVPGHTRQALDVDEAVPLVREAFDKRAAGGPNSVVTLPVTTHKPQVTQAEYNRALHGFAKNAMSGWVYLSAAGREIPFSQQTIGKFLTMKAVDGKLVPVVDPDEVAKIYGHFFDGVVIDAGAGKVKMTGKHAAAALVQALKQPTPPGGKRIAKVEGAQLG